jgi:hypothetical protein
LRQCISGGRRGCLESIENRDITRYFPTHWKIERARRFERFSLAADVTPLTRNDDIRCAGLVRHSKSSGSLLARSGRVARDELVPSSHRLTGLGRTRRSAKKISQN